MKHKELTGKIIDSAYKVHKILGFGFLESVYQNALLHELNKAGLKARKEQKNQVKYDDQIVGDFAADIAVEDRIILELKSIQELHPAHEAQLNNYLKATGMEVGLLINFGWELEVKQKINRLLQSRELTACGDNRPACPAKCPQGERSVLHSGVCRSGGTGAKRSTEEKMTPIEIDQETIKRIFKESLTETLHENRELLEEIISDVLEDLALSEAMRKGRETEKVSREEIFRTLEQD